MSRPKPLVDWADTAVMDEGVKSHPAYVRHECLAGKCDTIEPNIGGKWAAYNALMGELNAARERIFNAYMMHPTNGYHYSFAFCFVAIELRDLPDEELSVGPLPETVQPDVTVSDDLQA